MKSLLIGLTPPLEGGSQRHIFEISSRMQDCEVLTQRGSICKNKVEMPIIGRPVFLRNILFFFLALVYSIKLVMTRKKKYDVIHIHENLLYFLAPILKMRYKVIITVHGITGFMFFENKLLWFFFKKALNSADRIISVSVSDKKILDDEIGGVVYIPNGVESKIYKDIRRKSEKKVVFVGRIHEQKGIKFLLEAFEKATKKHKDYVLEIVGDKKGSLYEKLSSKFAKNKNILWKGFILNRKELFSEIASAEILVYPSLWEALPWPALLEGLASGRAVIASDLEGMRAIFEDGKDIILTEPGDSDALADKIEGLIENRPLALRIGKRGKETAGCYSWDNIAERVSEEYSVI